MNWELRNLTIELAQWGEFKGKYTGKIQFANGSTDAFTFALNEQQCAEYLALIAKTVGTSASVLSGQVMESLKFIELPKPVIEIQSHVEEN